MVARAIAGECVVEPREPTRFKGFTDPVPVFAVTG
jgi:hypothetical protein